jgi:hypothetical protein
MAALTAAFAVGLTVAPASPGLAETAGAVVSAGSHHRPRTTVKKRHLQPGVTFARIIDRRTPLRTFVLRLSPGSAANLDVTLATAALPARRTVEEIARAHGALAAVNGDFTDRRVGRPTHPFAQDGQLLQTSIQRGPLFGLSRGRVRAYLGKPELRLTMADRSVGRTWRIARWNQGPPAPGEIAGYSRLGGALEEPPPFSCWARLLPDGDAAPHVRGTAVTTDHVVDAAGCTEASPRRLGGIVLSAPPATDESKELLAMAPGTAMRLRWSLGWRGVADVVGGMPILVRRGRVVAPRCSSSFCRANPRTGIGFTRQGGVILVVVDGRRNRWSRGATLVGFAQTMKRLGAQEALNLDGGGSTTMVVNGDVVNRPSDGHQRRVSNAVLLLPGADPGEN